MGFNMPDALPPLYGIMGIVMIFFFPAIVGFISGLIVVLKKKLKTGMTLWSLILFSPIFYILISSFFDNSVGFIGGRFLRQPALGLTMASIMLPIVASIWFFGILILFYIRYSIGGDRNQENQKV